MRFTVGDRRLLRTQIVVFAAGFAAMTLARCAPSGEESKGGATVHAATGSSAAVVGAVPGAPGTTPNPAATPAAAPGTVSPPLDLTPPAGGCGLLNAGEALSNAGGYPTSISSCANHHTLVLQGGNLVIDPAQSLWASATTTGYTAAFQSDGDFVLYDQNGQVVWRAGTTGNPGAKMTFQNDGNLVIYAPGGIALWSSQIGKLCGALKSGQSLSLAAGATPARTSCLNSHELVVQDDGNFVWYGKPAPWATATGSGYLANMQTDGNLVLYDQSGSALWSSHTDGNSGAWLALQDDGNLVIYALDGDAVWSSQSGKLLNYHPNLLGVHTPKTIVPTVAISDGQRLLDLYWTVLGREHDAPGYRAAYNILQAPGGSLAATYQTLIKSQEFLNNVQSLGDTGQFIQRSYQRILQRNASIQEVAAQAALVMNYKDVGTPGQTLTWLAFMNSLYSSSEYATVSCQGTYYDYGTALKPTAFLLDDLFNGTARLQTINESLATGNAVNLNFGPEVSAVYDERMSILFDQTTQSYYAFARGQLAADQTFNVFILKSSDGLNFTNVSGQVFAKPANWNIFDPQVSVDHSVCPPRYTMMTECGGMPPAPGKAPPEMNSSCVSQTTQPFMAETWSQPTYAVKGCNIGAPKNTNPPGCNAVATASASTPVALSDGPNKYLGWTLVDFQTGSGAATQAPLPNDVTFTNGAAVPDFLADYGFVKSFGTFLLTAESNTTCNGASQWDCNNANATDWKKEGNQFYLIYNGSDYFFCGTPPAGQTDLWGAGMARSTSPIGVYTDKLPIERGIKANFPGNCNLSYPMVNNINGQLWVYFGWKTANAAQSYMARAKLVPVN